MAFTLSQHQMRLVRLHFYIKLLFILTVMGFIPWGNWFKIEAKNHLLNLLMNGLVGHISVLILITFIAIFILNKNKWFSGLALLLYPIIIMSGTLFILIWTISISEWHDLSIYKNGNRYLIIEMEAGLFARDNSYRAVVSRTANRHIRLLEKITYLNKYPVISNSKYLKLDNLIWEKFVPQSE